MSATQYVTVFCPRCGEEVRVQIEMTGIEVRSGRNTEVVFAPSPFDHTCPHWRKRLREHYRLPIFHAPAPEPEGWPVEVDPPCDIHTCDLCHPHQRINRRLNILQVQYLCLLAVVVILEWKVLW